MHMNTIPLELLCAREQEGKVSVRDAVTCAALRLCTL